MRKKFSLFMCCVLISSLLLGCSSKNTSTENAGKKDSASKTVELEFWTINLKANFGDYITGLIDTYESEHSNVKIKWVDVPGADITQKVITALTGNDIPDVVNLALINYAQLKPYKILLSLNDYADSNSFEPYIDGLMEAVTDHGQIEALPWYHPGTYVGFINSAIYKEAGLNPDNPPTTIDELLENGRIIHEKLPDVYGSNDFPTVQLLEAEGLPLISENGKKAVFNSAEHVSFLQKFVDAYKNGSLAPGAVSKDDRSFPQSFDTAQVGQWGWWNASEINNWEKNSPAILKDVKVIPAIHGSQGTIPMKVIQTLAIPKKTEHPKEAVDFALFLTNDKNQLEFCRQVAVFPSTRATLKDEFFKNIGTKSVQDQARKIIVDSSDQTSVSEISGLDNSETLIEYYNEEVRAALTGEKSLQEALDEAVKEWNTVLSKK